ncbi:glycosyltransferase [bacterium]|nr:glycosyltransferase [bacterium]
MADNDFEQNIENSLHKSEIDFLNSKHQFELRQAEIKFKAEYEFKLSKNIQKKEEELKARLEEQKREYEEKLISQRDWYEGEILRRQEETAEWHIENTKKLLEEQKKEFEEKLKEKEKEQISEIQTTTSVIDETNPVKVSVILPIYNVGKYLVQCLNSLISQTLYDIEIICVNDGSTDNCYDILESYKKKDARIKVIHKENEGTGVARNTGLKAATGECIAFVDPDDWIKENMLERLYNLLKEKELDIAMCMPDGYNEKEQKMEAFPYFVEENFKNIPTDKIFNWRDLSPFSYPMCVWNKLYLRKFLTDNHIDFAEKVDFEDHKVIFGALFHAKRIFFIPEKLYVYRFNREGSILSDNNKRLMDRMKMFDYVEQIMKDTGAYEVLKNELLLYQVHDLLYYYSMIKPEFKEEYFTQMRDNISKMNLNDEEKKMLCEKESDFTRILEKM